MKKLGLMLGVSLAMLAYPAMAQERLMEGLMEKLKIVRECAGDVERLCAGVVPGGDRIEACIKEKLTQLSPACVASLTKAVPDESKTAVERRFNNVRDVRYCEIWLIGGNPVTRDLKGAVYNTTELNNAANPRDTCPAEMWAKVDPEALKKQYDLLAVYKNGPRGWLYDWYALPVGGEHTFFGLQTLWYMQIELPKDIDMSKKGGSAYKSTTGLRASTQGYAKGKPVFILDDPSGTPWVMQAYSQIVDPNLTYDDLKTLDKKLKLPPGWKYRVKVLDQDLGIGAIDGKAQVLQDDLENTYNACFEADNKTNCNYKP